MANENNRPVVGLPRALLYYEYGHVWLSFLTALGVGVVVSQPTSRAAVDLGVRAAIDEACLPVKVAYGHCLELAPSVDLLFVPRVVSVERRAYSCPKLLGLPDMIRLAVPQRVGILAPLIDISRDGRKSLVQAARVTGQRCGSTAAEVRQAAAVLERDLPRAVAGEFMMAQGQRREAETALACPRPASTSASASAARLSSPANLKVGLIGHSYNLYDSGLNLGLLGRLRQLGANLVMPEDYPPQQLEEAAGRVLRKPLFWTLGRRLVAAANLMATDQEMAGLIAVESFGCGPDSMVVDLCMRLTAWQRPGLPFMELTLDEHTGEAGFVTRLEAFLDLAARQRAG
jgi:predicted nucleotide-binding protein (sugar kinase/HSP70/actin superfamily)